MKHSLASILTLATFAAGAAFAQVQAPPQDAPPKPGTADAAKPAASGFDDPEHLPYTVAEERTPLTEYDGFTTVVRITNTSPAPIALPRVELFGGASIHVGQIAAYMNVLYLPLTTEHEALGEVTTGIAPLGTVVHGHSVIAAAMPDRRTAVVAAVLTPDPRTVQFTMQPALDGDVALFASVPGPSEPLAAGATWTSPPLLCIQQGDALFVLDHVLERLAEAQGATTGMPPEPDVLESTALAALEPKVAPLRRVAGTDGSAPTLVRNPNALPLDLFDATARAQRYDLGYAAVEGAPDRERVLVLNTTAEATFARVRFVEVGLDPAGRFDVIDAANGATIGTYADAAVLPLPARSHLVLDFVPARADAPDAPRVDTGFEYLLIEPDLTGNVAKAAPFVPGVADAPATLERAFKRGGMLIAHHRGSAVLEPPAPLVERGLEVRVVPALPKSKRPPTTTAERRFVERASNVEWALHFEWRASPAVLLCPEAGFAACPLAPTIADGVPAAAGLIVPAGGGCVLFLIDQDPAAVAALANRYCSRDERSALAGALAQAQRAVFASVPKRGLFADLTLARMQRDDFVPADPAFTVVFSAYAFGPRRVRSLADADGEPLAEYVRGLVRPLTFALDIPTREPDEDILMVVRRGPLPPFASYTLYADSTPLGTVTSHDDRDDAWREDTFVLTGAAIGERQRIALTLATSGALVDIARIATFRIDTDGGAELASFTPTAGTPTRVRAGVETPLQGGGHAFVTGIALTAGQETTFALDGGARAIRATLAAARGSKPVVLRVFVDGVERYLSDPPLEADRTEPLTLTLRGAKTLTVRAEAVGEAAAGAGIAVLGDARLFP